VEFTNRYMALGDSFTEGMGDVEPQRPNQVRGWADRVAEVLCADPSWGYANLAIRGKKINQVITEQLPAALALKPTLITLYVGGNDILRPAVDIDALMLRYRQMIIKLADSGATLVLFTGFDSGDSAIFGTTRGRTAIYNEAVREIAEDTGALIADYWRWREFSDLRYWATDRLHMNTAGHTLMAAKVLELLGNQSRIPLPVLTDAAALTRLNKLREDAAWAKEHLVPWVKRRLTGTSSGDALSPKYPHFTSLQVPSGV
jgi:lysophospholipase L1-like esterase